MATGTNSARLAMSEHLPNRHVTMCRPGLHQSLKHLNLDLQLLKSQIDKQDARLSCTHSKLLGYSEAGKEAFSLQIAEEPKREPQTDIKRRVTISSLVVTRAPDHSSELLRSIEDKYAKRVSEITAREDAARLATIRSLRTSLTAQAAGKGLAPLHESSLYIHHYC